MKNAASLFVDYLLENEKNLILATIRLTEIMTLLNLFKHCKLVEFLSRIFGIFHQKSVSNELFMYLLVFMKNFQKITGGFT